MNYVEWLRVRGCLKWTAIILVACVGLVLFVRFTFLDIDVHSKMLSGVEIGNETFPQFEASSKETTTKLPDGTVRTVIDNPAKGIRITVDDRGYWGKHLELLETKPSADATFHSINVGDVHMKRAVLPNGSVLVTVDEGAALPEDLNYYFVFAAVAALIVATILGAPFARENEGHLEIALTKPVSRVNLALQTMVADFAGIAAAWAMTVLFLIIGHTIFEAPNYVWGPTDALAAGVGLLAGFAWYAMLTAATASMKRTYGGVLGTVWPIAIGISGVSKAPIGDGPLATVVHSIAGALLWLFPTSYTHATFTFGVESEGHSQTLLQSLPAQTDITILAILALVYGAFAIYQWQRVEA